MHPDQSIHQMLIPSQTILHYTNQQNPQTPHTAHSSIQPTLHHRPIGHSIRTKESNHFRVILQNPNGFSFENQLFEYQLCLENMKSISADILLFPETNLAWNRYDIQQLAHQYRQNTFQFSRQISSNSKHTYETPYQPGGTCSIITNKLVGRFHSSTTDPELGRWSVITLNIRHNRKLSIICCYQVCDQNINTIGPKTAFNQQWSILKRQGKLCPNPRKQFVSDLDHLLTKLRTSGHSIILAGDFNTSIGDNPHGIDRILNKHSLIDTIRHLHGDYTCSTYSRGRKCIDYIFASTDLLPALQRSGITPLEAITASDHCAVFIDIDIRACLDSDLSCLLRPPQRSLHSTHQRNRDIYVQHLHKAFQRHKIFDRIQTLSQLDYLHHQNTAESLAEAIDRDVTRLMIAAERRLHRPSPTPFSSNLAQACIKVSILKTKRLSLKHSTNKDNTIDRLLAKLQKPFTIPSTLTAVEEHLKTARKEVRDIRRNAIALRDEFLLSKASDPDNPTHITKIIARIRRAEELKRAYSKLRHLLKPTNKTLVTHIEVPADSTPPKNATNWTTITDPEEVIARLIHRNVKHFGSAHGTPFTVPPLSDTFDWEVQSTQHSNTLHGNPPQYDDPLLMRLLKHLCSRVPHSCPTITMKTLIRRLRHWKESTTTSPSRRHLGHYKALLPPSNYNLQSFLEEPEGQILSVHLKLLNFCASTGYSLRRWHKIVTMMIPKQNNNYKIHRMRVIHIYEADLTALFSIWSRQMVHTSTAHHCLNPGSFGARPGKTSSDPAFISLLQHEISAITRTNIAIAPNDAAQCYDRIIPNHAMLTCMAHGMSPSSAKCIGSTLLHAKYYLRTATNESSSYWSNTSQTPIYGTGQGSGISPGICCVTYSDLFDIHSDISTGSRYLSPVSSVQFPIYNIGYVDDTTTTVNDHHLNTPLHPKELSTLIQNDLQNWSNLLYLSGGALEFSKTELFLLSWKFNSHGIPYMEDTTPVSITLQCPSTSTPHSIHASSPLSTYKLLGFHLSPSQNINTQYTVLHTKAHRIAYTLSGSPVTRREAFLTYFSVFLPSISYVLPLTTFNKQQCHHIQSKPTQIFLQKAGFPSTLCRHVVFAPRSSGGIGFRDIYIEQGILHLTKLVQTLRTPGHPQQLIKLAIDEWQISSGCSHLLLTHPTVPCQHLEGTWLKSTREFLASISTSISIPHSYVPSPLRISDRSIMDSFNQLSGLGRKRLIQLNCCRLFLQVHYISELTNTMGTHLLPGFWTGDPLLRPAPPLHRYPRQQSPSPALWQLWRNTIRKCFCQPRTTKLRKPLGPWLPSKYRRFPCLSFYPPRLWHSSRQYSSYIKTTHDGIQFTSFDMISRLRTPIPTLHPIDILLATGTTTTVSHCPCPLPPTPPSPLLPCTFPTLLATLPPWKADLLCHLTCSISLSVLSATLNSTSTLSEHPFLAACDGSHNRSATFGWTIRNATVNLITCYGPVHGFQANSYRSEATGLLSLLVFLHSVQSFVCSTSAVSLPIYIDNSALCQRICQHCNRLYYSPSEALSAERDVLLQIECLLDSPLLNVSIHHIKSHQDRQTPLPLLSIPAQANCCADSLATSAHHETVSSPYSYLLPASGCAISLSNATITRQIPHLLRQAAHESPLHDWILTSRSWTHTEFIDWSQFKHFCLRPHLSLRFKVLWIHQTLPTGHILHRRNPRESPFCPACGSIETHTHFITCTHHSRTPLKIKLISDLRAHLANLPGDPILRDIALEGINSFITQTDLPPSRYPDRYHLLLTTQSGIGWHNFLRGFVSNEWTRLHHQYLKTHSLPSTTHQSLTCLPLVLEHLYTIWKFRNQQRHSSTSTNHLSELTRQTHTQIKELYQYRTSVLPTDQHIFHCSLSAHLKESLTSLQAWILNHSHYILQSHHHASQSNITNTRPLTHYFNSIT